MQTAEQVREKISDMLGFGRSVYPYPENSFARELWKDVNKMLEESDVKAELAEEENNYRIPKSILSVALSHAAWGLHPLSEKKLWKRLMDIYG
jgi:hypothetical protein